MELPDNVLALIREYSKPLTLPDWKTVRSLSGPLFYANLYYLRYKYRNQLYIRVFSNLTQTTWGRIYMNVRMFGIQHASNHFEISVDEMYNMPGIMYAQDYYTTHNNDDEKFYHSSFSHILEY